MADDSIGVATGTDAYLDTVSRTIDAQERHAHRIVLGWSSDATYSVVASNASTETTNDHLLQIMGDGTNYSRLLRYRITPMDVPAAADILEVAIYRLATAGTGGTGITPHPLDAADSAYAGGAMKLPSSKGTEGTLLGRHRIPVTAAAPTLVQAPWTWEASPYGKPIVFGTGAANGIAWKIMTGVASCAVDIVAEFVVTSFA